MKQQNGSWTDYLCSELLNISSTYPSSIRSLLGQDITTIQQVLTPKQAIRRMFQIPAALVYIMGRMGKGKTDFALLITEIMKNDIDMVITNIRTDTNFEFVTTVSKLMELLEEPGKKLSIIDEAGINVDSRRSSSKVNVAFKGLARLIRKKNSHLIIISQKWRDVDIALKELVSSTVHKISKKKAFLNILEPFTRKPILLENVPPTSIPYDTNDVAELRFDVDTEKINQLLNKPSLRIRLTNYIQTNPGCTLQDMYYVFTDPEKSIRARVSELMKKGIIMKKGNAYYYTGNHVP